MTRRDLTELEMFRAQELLLARATIGLSAAEDAELAALGADDDLSFDLAAAAIDLATLSPDELAAGLPPGLADKVLVAAGVPVGIPAKLPAVPTTLAGVVRPTDTRRTSASGPGVEPTTLAGLVRPPDADAPRASASGPAVEPTTLAGMTLPPDFGPTTLAGAALPDLRPTTLAGAVPPRPIGAPPRAPGDTQQWAIADVDPVAGEAGPLDPDQWSDADRRPSQPNVVPPAEPPGDSGRIQPAIPAGATPAPGQRGDVARGEIEVERGGAAISSPRQPRDGVVSLEEAREKRRAPRTATFAWIAAAACLALAAGAWLWATTRAPNTTEVAVQPKPAPTAAEARAALLASAKDVATFAWTATDDPSAKGATGDVVWSASEQRGYMRFVGLAPNDVAQLQYQLWIFDATRDEKFPVDGGVFDVTSTGEVIVPISAKLRVGDVKLFAVTVEKPGGVVVSKRERIVVTAAPRTS